MPDQTLAQRVKAKYPGVYDDVSDVDLEQKVTAKYPGVYDDVPRTEMRLDQATVPRRPESQRDVDASEARFQAKNNPSAYIAELLRNAPGDAMSILKGAANLLATGAASQDRRVPSTEPSPIPAMASHYAEYADPSRYALMLRDSPVGTAADIGMAAEAGVRGASGVASAAPAAVAPTARAAAKAIELTRRPNAVRTLRAVANKFDPPPVRTPAAKVDVAGGMSRSQPIEATPAPAPVAAPIAAPPVAEAPAAPPVSPPPAASAAQTPPATPSARPPSAMSPQRIQNELGLTARRTGVKLTEEEYTAAGELVAQGKSPAEAIARTVGSRAAVAEATRFRMNAAETTVYNRLRKGGKTHQEAVTSIEEQRKLAEMLGTPSPEEARQKVQQRNKLGQWKTPTGYFPPRD